MISMLLTVFIYTPVNAQDTIELKAASYTKTINERADKIIAKLGISNAKKYQSVKNIIAGQYRNLNTIYENRDEQKKSIKAAYGTNKVLLDSLLKNLENGITEKVA